MSKARYNPFDPNLLARVKNWLTSLRCAQIEGKWRDSFDVYLIEIRFKFYGSMRKAFRSRLNIYLCAENCVDHIRVRKGDVWAAGSANGTMPFTKSSRRRPGSRRCRHRRAHDESQAVQPQPRRCGGRWIPAYAGMTAWEGLALWVRRAWVGVPGAATAAPPKAQNQT